MKANTNKRNLSSVRHQIIKLRNEMGLTQEKFARKCGFPRSTIAKIESGHRDVKATEIVQFAESLNVTTDYLFGRERTKAPDDFIHEVEKRYGLSEETQNFLKQIFGNSKNNDDLKILYNFLLCCNIFHDWSKYLLKYAYADEEYQIMTDELIKQKRELEENLNLDELYANDKFKSYFEFLENALNNTKRFDYVISEERDSIYIKMIEEFRVICDEWVKAFKEIRETRKGVHNGKSTKKR